MKVETVEINGVIVNVGEEGAAAKFAKGSAKAAEKPAEKEQDEPKDPKHK